MNKDDVELLDDDDELDISEIKPIAPIDIDITKPIEIIDELDDTKNKPTLIDPDVVLKSVSTKTTEKETVETITAPQAKVISPEDVVTQINNKTPQMISAEDVIAQVGSTRSQVPSKTLANVQKKLEQVEGISEVKQNSKETITPKSPNNGVSPTPIYIPPSYDKIKEEKVNSYKNLNKDYRITLLFVAVVILFSLGIITSIFDTSSSKKTTKSKNRIDATSNIIEKTNSNSYFYAPMNNKIKSGQSNDTTYYLLGDEKSGQSEIFNIFENKYKTEGSNIDNGQYDKLMEVGPIKNNKNINIILPTNYNKLNERIIKSSNKDGSIIVIKSSTGISNIVEEHLRLMNQLGAEKTIVFINNDDETKDTNSMIKELKKLFKKTGYDKNTPVIVGNAKDEKSADELYKTMTEWIKIVPSVAEEPLRAHINGIVKNGDAIQVSIQIEKGTIKVGEKVKLLGNGYSHIGTVSGININNEKKDKASADNEYDEISIIIKTKYENSLNSAKELVSENEDDNYSKFYAVFYFSDDNNQKNRKFNNGYTTEIQLKNSINGKISIPKGVNYLLKDDTSNLTIELSEKTQLYKGQQFTINDQENNIFGYGEVVGIIE